MIDPGIYGGRGTRNRGQEVYEARTGQTVVCSLVSQGMVTTRSLYQDDCLQGSAFLALR